MSKYAIINSSNQVINTVNSDRTPDFLTSSGDTYVEITDAYKPHPCKDDKYHAASDKFVQEPHFTIIYKDSDDDGEPDGVLWSDPHNIELFETPRLTSSVNLDIHWGTPLANCDESDWSATNATISNYSFNSGSNLVSMTLTPNGSNNHGDSIQLKVPGPIVDTYGFTWETLRQTEVFIHYDSASAASLV